MSHHKVLPVPALSGLFFVVLSCAALAQAPPAVPAAPPLPGTGSGAGPEVGAGAADELEPEITIIRRGRETIEEYRINGRLYMIKITPRKGIPYFLVDADGDGDFEVRQNELDEELRIPQWVILRW